MNYKISKGAYIALGLRLCSIPLHYFVEGFFFFGHLTDDIYSTHDELIDVSVTYKFNILCHTVFKTRPNSKRKKKFRNLVWMFSQDFDRFNTFSARRYPKMTKKKSLKKSNVAQAKAPIIDQHNSNR